jgi:hypothetical protein
MWKAGPALPLVLGQKWQPVAEQAWLPVLPAEAPPTNWNL